MDTWKLIKANWFMFQYQFKDQQFKRNVHTCGTLWSSVLIGTKFSKELRAKNIWQPWSKSKPSLTLILKDSIKKSYLDRFNKSFIMFSIILFHYLFFKPSYPPSQALLLSFMNLPLWVTQPRPLIHIDWINCIWLIM